MKNLFCMISIVFISKISFSQNLVPNPSFEQHTACPTLGGFNDDEVMKCTGWWSFGNTSDYFNTCAVSPYVTVPYNGFGYQLPSTGNGYCGLYVFGVANYHEFIGTRLNQPLEIGQQYYIEFKVCSGSGGYFQPGVFTNNLGARFLMDSFSTDHPVPLTNLATINCSSIISDTINWTKIMGYFTADSSYSYIAFGNFFTDAMTDTLQFGQYVGRAYYFIDDACVAVSPEDCPLSYTSVVDGWNDSQLFLFPNPANDVLRIKLPNKIVRNLEVRNELNFEVIEKQVSPIDAYVNLNVAELPDGIYMLTLHGIEKDFVGKFLVIHQ